MTSTAARSPGRALVWLLGVLPAAIIALAAGLAFTGAARPGELVDPGTLVRWGLPVATVVARVAAFLTVGAFGICAFVVAGPGRGARSRQASPAWSLAARIGTVSAVTWTLAQVAHVVFGYAQIWGRPLDSPTFGQELRVFLTATELGIAYFWATVLAAVVSLFAVATAGMTMAAWTTALGAVALVPIALTGHSQGAVAHNLAVSSMWLHLVPLALWVGGLATLGVVVQRLGAELPRAARRYSALALWCFALVGVSGVFSSVIRLNSPAELFTTSWGAILGLKILLWIGLGVMGWLHRERTIPQLAERPAVLAPLAGVEVLVMGAVTGLAVVLARPRPRCRRTPWWTRPRCSSSAATRSRPAHRGHVVHPVASRPAVPGGGGERRRRLPGVGAARDGARRPLAGGTHRLVAGGLGRVHLGDQRRAVRVRHPVLRAHGHAHDARDAGAGVLDAAAPITLALRALPTRRDGSRGPGSGCSPSCTPAGGGRTRGWPG